MPSYFTCMSKYPLSFFQGGSCWMENLISYKSVAYSENVKALKCPIFHCVEHISCHYHLNIHENKFLYNRRETEQIMNLKSTQFILSNYVNLCSVSMLILCIDRQGVFQLALQFIVCRVRLLGFTIATLLIVSLFLFILFRLWVNLGCLPRMMLLMCRMLVSLL